MGGEAKTSATKFLDEHPDLRRVMSESASFAELKARESFPVDGEVRYVVRGDTFGGEDELFLDALARGADPVARDELSRALFLELSKQLREVVEARFKGRQT
ncbi:MAG TPA: hypothetical protein VF297_27185 [Pyrinomonadaceae bacterium]